MGGLRLIGIDLDIRSMLVSGVINKPQSVTSDVQANDNPVRSNDNPVFLTDVHGVARVVVDYVCEKATGVPRVVCSTWS